MAATTLTHTWFLTGRRLRVVVRQPAYIAMSMIQPVIWLFLFGQLFRKVVEIPGFSAGGSYLDYLIPGIIAMNAMSANMWTGMGLLEEIERGTLNRFLVSPASRTALMNANVAELAVSTSVQSLIILALGWIGGADYPGGVPGMVVIVVTSILLGTVFGSLSNAVAMTSQQRDAIIGTFNFVMLPLTFLSSAFMPRDLMPGWMRPIAAANPLDWAVHAGRSALSADPAWGEIAVRTGGLLALAAACVAISVATFRTYQKSV